MFNNRQSEILEKTTFEDEFENRINSGATTTKFNKTEISGDERTLYNSRISDNFDRIIHYDTIGKQSDIENAYEKYSEGVNNDIYPSKSTMQFKGASKAEVYQDYRAEETAYESSSRVSSKSKVIMAVIAVVIVLLSTLIVLNTRLLNDMNELIKTKQETVQSLQTDKSIADENLADISSDESVKKAAEDLGMVPID